MAALPTTVTVGPHAYRVRCDSDSTQVCSAGDSTCVGHTSHADLAIDLRTGLAPSFERETLLHETIHAAWYVAGLQASVVAPARGARRLRTAPALLDVLIRNPELTAYVTASD